MSRRFSFHPLARTEAVDARRWYQNQQPGLGVEFTEELDRVLAEIEANPARFGFAEGDIREGLLDRFPYAVYYRVRRNRIRVLAVYHTSRDPAGWKNRV